MILIKNSSNNGRRVLFAFAILFTTIIAVSLLIFLAGKITGINEWSKLGYQLKIIGISGGLIFFSILYLLYEKLSPKIRLLNWACLVLGVILAICYYLVFLS